MQHTQCSATHNATHNAHIRHCNATLHNTMHKTDTLQHQSCPWRVATFKLFDKSSLHRPIQQHRNSSSSRPLALLNQCIQNTKQTSSLNESTDSKHPLMSTHCTSASNGTNKPVHSTEGLVHNTQSTHCTIASNDTNGPVHSTGCHWVKALSTPTSPVHPMTQMGQFIQLVVTGSKHLAHPLHQCIQ